MRVAKLELKKGNSVKLESEGELLHHAHLLLETPVNTDSDCCPKETYRRIRIESTRRPLQMFLNVINRYYSRCKRRYIRYEDAIIDPLTVRLEPRLLEGSYKAVIDHYYSNIPLLTMPGDEILMSFYSHSPFTVRVEVDW
jgi:hypothetical protein